MWYNGISLVYCSVRLDAENTRTAKYHEVTILAMEAAINAPTEDVTRDARVFCGQLLKSWIVCLISNWDFDKEMIGWGLGESHVLLPLVLLSVEDVWNNDFGEK